MLLPRINRYRILIHNADLKFLYEDNRSSCKIMCLSCGTSMQKSLYDVPIRALRQTHILSLPKQQVDKWSALNETSDQLLGPGPALPGLTLTLVKMNMLLLYCVLTMYLYPFNPLPYSNVLCAKVKVSGFPQPSPAWLRPWRVARLSLLLKRPVAPALGPTLTGGRLKGPDAFRYHL